MEAWDVALVESGRPPARRASSPSGLHTAVGRGLYARGRAPALAERHHGVRAHPGRWDGRISTAGLGDGSSDVALVWLPLPDDPSIATRVISRSLRRDAGGNPLEQDAEDLTMDDLLEEPFVALAA